MFPPLSRVKGRTELPGFFGKTTCNGAESAGRAELCQSSERAAHLPCSCGEVPCPHTSCLETPARKASGAGAICTLFMLCSREPYTGTRMVLVIGLPPPSSTLAVPACAELPVPGVNPSAHAVPAPLHPAPASEGHCHPAHPLWEWQRCLCKRGSESFTVLFHRARTAGAVRSRGAASAKTQRCQPDEPVSGFTDKPREGRNETEGQ